MAKLKLGLIFGGRSVEHEVSVITALQAYENLDKGKYEIVPIYVSKAGDFYTSPKFLDLKNYKDVDSLVLSATKVTFIKSGLQTLGFWSKFISLDLAFPLIHGTFGEDGTLQGLLEMMQIPYIGFGVIGSAIGMDKIASKLLFQALGLPIGKYVAIKRGEKPNLNGLKSPLIVKPATVGSSIGVNKVDTSDDLEFYIEVAGTYADKILIEEAFEDVIEVNCAALGYKDSIVSVCEQPVASTAVLSYADKYQRGGQKTGGSQAGMASAQRIIPAPISQSLTKKIQNATLKIFEALDGCGVARVDFFVDPKSERFWVNEINTIPGSQAYYLFTPKKISYTKLLDILVESALQHAKDQSKTQYTFASGLLSKMAKADGMSKAPASAAKS